jgi:hypothetical protein
VQHLKTGLAVYRWQVLPCHVVALLRLSKEYDEGNVMLTKDNESIPPGVIRTEGHRTPKNPSREAKGDFGQEHG